MAQFNAAATSQWQTGNSFMPKCNQLLANAPAAISADLNVQRATCNLKNGNGTQATVGRCVLLLLSMTLAFYSLSVPLFHCLLVSLTAPFSV